MRTLRGLLASVLCLAGCGPDATAEDASDPQAGFSASLAAATAPTLFTVVFENHDYREIVGSADAPFFNELIAQYGLATNYADCDIHPSLPNYLCLISGAPQFAGGADPLPTAAGFPVTATHLGSQLLAAGIPFKAYQESMGTPCKLKNSGKYAPRHDPFLYFADVQQNASLCAQTNVDFSQLSADLAADSVRYFFITPNLTNDGHNPSSNPAAALRQSDTWARAEIGKLMASAAYKRGGVIFITWDEAEGRNADSADQVPMIIVSPKVTRPGFQSARAYSHRSYLATVEDLLGLPRLATVKNEPSMLEFLAGGTGGGSGTGGGGGGSTGGGAAHVFVNEVLANEPGSLVAGEFIELFNGGTAAADLAGWTLSDGTAVRHRFASGTSLAAGATLVVFGASGGIPPGTPGALASSTGSLSLGNSGDAVTLADAQGATVDTLTYPASLAAVDGVSMNRAPDRSPSGPLVLHTTLSARGASPGVSAAGTP